MANCDRCGNEVILVGGYFKLGARYRHIPCYNELHEIEVRNKVKQEELEAREAEEARRVEAERQAKIAADAKRRAEQEAEIALKMAKAQADAAVAATIANEKARAAQFAPKPAASPGLSELTGIRPIELE